MKHDILPNIQAEWTNDYGKSLKNWPNKGTVEFHNYAARYRPRLPLVLNKFNCFVKGEEKVSKNVSI